MDTDSEGESSYQSSPRPYSAGGFVADMAGFSDRRHSGDRYLASDDYGPQQGDDDPYNFEFREKKKKKKKKKRGGVENSAEKQKRLEREAQVRELLGQQFDNFSESEEEDDELDDGDDENELDDADDQKGPAVLAPKNSSFEEPMEVNELDRDEDFEETDSLDISESDFRVGGYENGEENQSEVGEEEEFAASAPKKSLNNTNTLETSPKRVTKLAPLASKLNDPNVSADDSQSEQGEFNYDSNFEADNDGASNVGDSFYDETNSSDSDSRALDQGPLQGKSLLLSPPAPPDYKQSDAASNSDDNANDVLEGYSEESGDQHEDSLFEGSEKSGENTTDLAETSGSFEASIAFFKAGDRVRAKISNWKQYYPGTISAANLDGTYQILFDDGEVAQHVDSKSMEMEPPKLPSNIDAQRAEFVEPSMLEIGQKVKAKIGEWKQAYGGEIIAVHRLDNTYRIRFNDGEVVDNIERPQITSIDGSTPRVSASMTSKPDSSEISEVSKRAPSPGISLHAKSTLSNPTSTRLPAVDETSESELAEITESTINSQQLSQLEETSRSEAIQEHQSLSPHGMVANEAALKAASSMGDNAQQSTTLSHGLAPTYVVSSRVEAKVTGWKQFYAGTVVAVNEDKTYNVVFDDDETVDNVTLEQLRPASNSETVHSVNTPLESVPGSTQVSNVLEVNVPSITSISSHPEKTIKTTTKKENTLITKHETQQNKRDKDVAVPKVDSTKLESPTSPSADLGYREKLKFIKRSPRPKSIGTQNSPPQPQTSPRKPSKEKRARVSSQSPSIIHEYNEMKLKVVALEKQLDQTQHSHEIELDMERRESDLLRGVVETRNAEIAGLKARLKELESVAKLRESLRKVAEAAATTDSKTRSQTSKVGRGEPKLRDASEIGPELLLEIEKEMEAQERLLAGYQKENERLMEQLKECEKKTEDTSKALYRENLRLGMEVNALDNLQRSKGLTASQLAGGGQGIFAPKLGLDEGSPLELSALGEDDVLSGTSGPPIEKESGGNAAELLRSRLNAEVVIQELRDELKESRRRSNLRLSELKMELNQARNMNKELECKLAGFNGLDQFNNDVAQQTEAVEKLRKELDDARMEHEREAKALKDKLSWYAENQELLTANDKMIREQRTLITQLHKALVESNSRWKPEHQWQKQVLQFATDARNNAKDESTASTSPARPATKRGNRSLASDLKRIRSLEKQVEELTDALKKRNPDCIANLIAASGPSPEHRKEFVVLKNNYEALEASFEEREKEHAITLRALRQDYEKLKLRYTRLQEAQRERAGKPAGAALKKDTAPRISQLEQELERVREFYRKKLEETSKRVDAANRKSQPGAGDQDVHLQRNVDRLRATNVALLARVQELEQSLMRNDSKQTKDSSHESETVATLRKQVARLKASQHTPQHGNKGNSRGMGNTTPLDLLEAIEAADSVIENHQSVSPDSSNVVTDTPATTTTSRVGRAGSQESRDTPDSVQVHHMREQLAESEREKAALLRRIGYITAQRPNAEPQDSDDGQYSEVYTKLSKEFDARIAQLEEKAKQERKIGESHWEHALERSEEEVRRLREINVELNARLQNAERELEVPRTPSMLQQLTLAKRVEDLERKLNQREKELDRIVTQVQGAAEVDMQLLKQKYELKLEQKDAQIRKFREELQSIMKTINQVS